MCTFSYFEILSVVLVFIVLSNISGSIITNCTGLSSCHAEVVVKGMILTNISLRPEKDLIKERKMRKTLLIVLNKMERQCMLFLVQVHSVRPQIWLK